MTKSARDKIAAGLSEAIAVARGEPVVDETLALIHTSDREAAIIAASPLAEDYRVAEAEAQLAISAAGFTFVTPAAVSAWKRFKDIRRRILGGIHAHS